MKTNSNSYFLFGGSFFTRLIPLLEKQGKVTGQMRNISPLSDLSASAQTANGSLTNWLSELDNLLESNSAEFFVLDLQNALQQLLYVGGYFVNASEDDLKQLTRKEIAIVDPLLLDQEFISDALNRFTDTIKKHFNAKQIILIHTNSSAYWLVGNNLRADNSPAPDAKHTQWLNNLEQQFCKKTACHFVDVTRFYFYQKEAGKPLTNAVYEKECYRDVANRILSITSNRANKSTPPTRPDFSLSLDRYVSYYFTLQKKPQHIYLNSQYFLDNLVLSSSANFVKKYREELIELDTLDWSDPEKALCLLQKLKPNDAIVKILTAFLCVVNGQYFESDVDYALMFRSEVVPDELIAYLKKNYASEADLLPVQINRYNAGYHFAKMVGLDPKSFSTEETVAYPTVVDVFGSCFSRTPLNVQDNDFAVNHYWFHVPPFEHRNKIVDYDSNLFPAKPSWKDRLVKLQFEGKLYQDIENSKSNWLLLDPYFLVSPNNFYYKEQDCLYGDFDHRISKILKAQRVNLILNPNFFGTIDDLFHAMDPWIEVIKKKYGKRIILITGQRTDYWIGDDDRIYRQPANHEPCNILLEKANEYLRTQLDCYMISIAQYFLPDDLGYMQNTPTHKENLCYFAEHDLIRYIVDNMPQQKIFAQYEGQIHMKHLEHLAKNNSPSLLNEALPLSELDKAVLKLGWEKMLKQHDELAELYDKTQWSMSIDEIVDKRTSNPALVETLRIALKKGTEYFDEFAESPRNYEEYSSDENIISGFVGNCTLPYLPKISIKQIHNQRGNVEISWNAPANTCIRIYRRSGQSPWMLVGKSTTGSFYDKSIAPQTNYQYSLCVEVAGKEHLYLANFTAPVSLNTVLATPVLINAVNHSGENILTWSNVTNAECYLVYHKDKIDDKWQFCATVSANAKPCYKEPSKFADGGEWYTVRAQRVVKGIKIISGFENGIPALPL